MTTIALLLILAAVMIALHFYARFISRSISQELGRLVVADLRIVLTLRDRDGHEAARRLVQTPRKQWANMLTQTGHKDLSDQAKN